MLGWYIFVKNLTWKKQGMIELGIRIITDFL